MADGGQPSGSRRTEFSRDAVRRCVDQTLEAARKRGETWRGAAAVLNGWTEDPWYIRGLWLPAHTIAERFGVSVDELRSFREQRVAPRAWRPFGYQIFYHVTKFEKWRAAREPQRARQAELTRRRAARINVAEWLSPNAIARRYNVAITELRAMREACVGPQAWRPDGHRILYHRRAFEAWLAGCCCSEVETAERIVGVFLKGRRHDCDSWEPCSTVSSSFRDWCIAGRGALPLGWRRELWRQIKSDSSFKITWRLDADRKLRRIVDMW